MKLIEINPRAKRKRRRSERRLGQQANPASRLEQSTSQPSLVMAPAFNFWQNKHPQIVGGLLLLLFIWMAYLLFSMEEFYVQGADIQGNKLLTQAEIYAASQVHHISVFWLDPTAIQSRVESLPNIKSAQVKVSLPAKINIDVIERQPELIWQTGDAVWWMDNEGTVVPPRAEGENAPTRLTIIDSDARPVQADDTIDPSIIRGAQIVQAQYPELETLLYDDLVGLIFITPEGWPVYLGNSQKMTRKLSVAEAMRQSLIDQNSIPNYIDVRNPLRVVYQPRQNSVEGQ